MKADLYCTSNCSVGSLDIAEIISLASENEVDTISITDVATFSGSKKARILGKSQNVEVIPGCTLYSSYDIGKEKIFAQISCFCPKYMHALEHIFEKEKKILKNRASILIQKLLCLCSVPPEMIFRNAKNSVAPFKSHLVQALLDSGYSHPDISIVIDKLSGEERKTSVGTIFPSTKEVIGEVHRAGGLAVLTFQESCKDEMQRLLENINGIIALGIDGVQVWHPSLLNLAQELEIIADEHNLIKIGGSEFRGCYGNEPHIIASQTTPEDEVKKIKKITRACV